MTVEMTSWISKVMAIMTWKFRPFPRVNISVQIIFIIWSKNRENPQFSRHYDNNAVNIGQHYFHNVNFRFAQILIMKIILTDIHGHYSHNVVKIFLVCTRFHNEKSLPVRQITEIMLTKTEIMGTIWHFFGQNYFHNRDQNFKICTHYENNFDQNFFAF